MAVSESKDLYIAYSEYCSESGYLRKSQNVFCPSLVTLANDRLGHPVDSWKSRTGKKITGVRLRRIDDPFPEDWQPPIESRFTAATDPRSPSAPIPSIDPPVTTVTTCDDPVTSTPTPEPSLHKAVTTVTTVTTQNQKAKKTKTVYPPPKVGDRVVHYIPDKKGQLKARTIETIIDPLAGGGYRYPSGIIDHKDWGVFWFPEGAIDDRI
jgi:hypothetical protein